MGLPVEAEGGELIHVAAVDLGQWVRPQGAAIHQPYVPAGGAPGLQLLLYTSQDLLVMRRGDLGAVTPVHLQGETRTQLSLQPSSLTFTSHLRRSCERALTDLVSVVFFWIVRRCDHHSGCSPQLLHSVRLPKENRARSV